MSRNPPKAPTLRLSAADIKRIMDPFEFISHLMIVDKRGRLVKLRLNSEQIKIVEALLAGVDVLVLKPRQIGASTAVAAYYFWLSYTSTEPTTHVVVSHKAASAKHIFSIMVRFHTNLPTRFQRELSVVNTTTLTFADSGATIKAESAGADGGFRSFTASTCHISEYAFADNAAELKATVISALNGGQLCIESTANHWSDPVHVEIGLAESKEVAWDFLFFPWTDHEEYASEPPEDFELDRSSQLTPEQQHWAQVMRGKLGESKFKREYPLTLMEAYAQLDGAWMPDGSMAHLAVLRMDAEGGAIGTPDRSDKYAIGVDAAAGTGGDYSVIAVTSVSTGQLVEIRRSNQLSPSLWAMQVADASNKWGKAKACVESNGTWGGVIVTELKHMNIPQWTDEKGNHWTTDGVTKPKMLEYLKDAITSGRLQQVDDRTHSELRAFQVDDRGMPFCPRVGGHHGDSVIALALSLQCALSIRIEKRAILPQWIKDRKTAQSLAAGAFTEHRRY